MGGHNVSNDLHILLPVSIMIIGYHTIVGFNTLESYDFEWITVWKIQQLL
jgi:hypothetical protein